jgi:hypothetical protein
MPLAPPVAFDDLRPLIRRDHALHLEEELIFWALAQGPVAKHDLHPGPPNLIDQPHRVGVLPGQLIGGVDLEAIHRPSGDDSTPPLQGRSDEGRPTVPFIQALHRLGHHQAIAGDALTQRRHLAGNGLSHGLLV